MRHLMFIRHSADLRTEDIPPALIQAIGEFAAAGFTNGTLVDTAGLQPTGKQIALRKGRITTTDGPFTEAKELVGGYAIVDADSFDAAVEIARQFLDLHRVNWPGFEGECEVRPFQVG